MGNHGRRAVSQNAGVLVVLVFDWYWRAACGAVDISRMVFFEWWPGSHLSIKTVFPLCSWIRLVRPSYFHNGNPYNGKMVSLYWDGPQSDLHWRKAINDTFRPKQNGWYVADDNFKCVFFKENVRVFIQISVKFVYVDKQLIKVSIGSGKWLDGEQATSHCLNQIWLSWQAQLADVSLARCLTQLSISFKNPSNDSHVWNVFNLSCVQMLNGVTI